MTDERTAVIDSQADIANGTQLDSQYSVSFTEIWFSVPLYTKFPKAYINY